jgi:hypothetical protein
MIRTEDLECVAHFPQSPTEELEVHHFGIIFPETDDGLKHIRQQPGLAGRRDPAEYLGKTGIQRSTGGRGVFHREEEQMRRTLLGPYRADAIATRKKKNPVDGPG